MVSLFAIIKHIWKPHFSLKHWIDPQNHRWPYIHKLTSFSHLNPYNAEDTFVQSTRTQRFLKTWSPAMLVLSHEYPCARVLVIFQFLRHFVLAKLATSSIRVSHWIYPHNYFPSDGRVTCECPHSSLSVSALELLSCEPSTLRPMSRGITPYQSWDSALLHTYILQTRLRHRCWRPGSLARRRLLQANQWGMLVGKDYRYNYYYYHYYYYYFYYYYYYYYYFIIIIIIINIISIIIIIMIIIIWEKDGSLSYN